MRRLHLLEIEDQPWCPAVLRDAATDFLQFMIVRTDTYAPALPLLQSALERAGTRQVVDLCSGGGGPWPGLLPLLDAADAGVQVRLTDRYPNREAFERANERTGGRLAFHGEPVDATALPNFFAGADLDEAAAFFARYTRLARSPADDVLERISQPC